MFNDRTQTHTGLEQLKSHLMSVHYFIFVYYIYYCKKCWVVFTQFFQGNKIWTNSNIELKMSFNNVTQWLTQNWVNNPAFYRVQVIHLLYF